MQGFKKFSYTKGYVATQNTVNNSYLQVFLIEKNTAVWQRFYLSVKPCNFLKHYFLHVITVPLNLCLLSSTMIDAVVVVLVFAVHLLQWYLLVLFWYLFRCRCLLHLSSKITQINHFCPTTDNGINSSSINVGFSSMPSILQHVQLYIRYNLFYLQWQIILFVRFIGYALLAPSIDI